MLKHVNPDLLQITNAYMYTEYPHKSYWSMEMNDAEYRSALLGLLKAEPESPLLLYVHMLYCTQLCWFCTCHIAQATKNYELRLKYLDLLFAEIDLLREFCDANGVTPNFREIHLGGGSPTDLKAEDFDRLVAKLESIVRVKKLDEFTIEIDPRRTTREMLRHYHQKGINRISIGVQDFDPEVQKAINRIQPSQLTEDLLDAETRDLFFNGINFDIICGLPHQTKETIQRTAEECVRLSPDRICLNYLHLSPEFSKHQKIMFDGRGGRPAKLPDYFERKELFVAARDTLIQNGFVRIGYDHFARPTDSVAKALQKGNLRWNALGVTAGRYASVIGVGAHSYGTIGNSYFQNAYDVQAYEKALAQNLFPVFRGHTMTRDDLIRRDVIQTLRSFFSLDFKSIEKKYDLDFRNYFREEIQSLDNFIADELVELGEDRVIITEKGHQFANTICYMFDAYQETRPRF